MCIKIDKNVWMNFCYAYLGGIFAGSITALSFGQKLILQSPTFYVNYLITLILLLFIGVLTMGHLNWRWEKDKRRIPNSKTKKPSKGLNKGDYLYVAILPLLLIFVMLLPLEVRTNLKLNLVNYDWWQFWTQSFVQNSTEHLIFNILPYIILSLLGLYLSKLYWTKRKFWQTILFIVFTLPIVSSLIQLTLYPLILPQAKTSAGTSGIIASIFGIVIFLFNFHFNKIYSSTKLKIVRLFLFYITFLFIISIFSYYTTSINSNKILIILHLLILPLLFLFIFRNIIVHPKKYSLYFIALILFLIIYPIILFPSKLEILLNKGMTPDFYMHYIGIVYGIVTMNLFKYKEKS